MLCYTNFPAHSFVSPRGALFPTSMWGLKSQLTHVFPRQWTSQQVHSPFHLQEEALPTRITKTVSWKQSEPRACTVFHIRITKQKAIKAQMEEVDNIN